jgi:anion transporter
MSDLTDVIKNVPLFSGLSREDLANVLGKMEEQSCSAGTTIFYQGDQGNAFYLIQSGAVQVVVEAPGGGAEVMAVLGPREWFGEMALLSGEPRSATIVAIKETTVWRLSRGAWDQLIEKHPSWLMQLCATLSSRLYRVQQQYSQDRGAFNTLAEEFYGTRSPLEQQLLRRAALITTIDPKIVGSLLETDQAEEFLAALEKSKLPLIRPVNGGYELHGFFKDFLTEKLLAVEGREGKQRLHAQLATLYEALKGWDQAIHHRLEAKDWSGAVSLLTAHKEELLETTGPFLKNAIDRIPLDHFFSDPSLVHLKADALVHSGDMQGAIRAYKEALSQTGSGILGAQALTRYQHMAEAFLQESDYPQALNSLRTAFKLTDPEPASFAGDVADAYWQTRSVKSSMPLPPPSQPSLSIWSYVNGLASRFFQKSSLSRWIGGILGVSVWAYLWFAPLAIDLEPNAVKQLALLCMALFFWSFWVLPEHGTALLLAVGYILTGLSPPESVLSGFASTTWFMSLGALGLGAAITASGLFYRLSLQLVRFFPLGYHWQTIALGFMGVVITAIIPQKSARATIISQMILNLSESLGYKNPSRASTGLFAATFLGLGQLNFLYLTGATATLLAWGLLPVEVRAQFSWGYWFLAAFPPTLIVIAVVLLSINLIYRPESQARGSYKMVRNQLAILGPLSREEWITLFLLILTVSGWLTFSYHGIHAAWISLLGLCILINTGVLGWGMLKKIIDWEFLLYLGATLNIPALLAAAKADVWLGSIVSPAVSVFSHNLPLAFVAIALIAFALKLVFSTRLTVITLCVVLVPMSVNLGINPWVMTMIILMGAEAWFFRFQIDWHTIAYATTEGKGFTYPLMYRVNPFFALGYILALLAAIPYWRYLGLIT